MEIRVRRRLEAAQQIAKQYGFEKATDDYHDVLSDPEVDAVVILTRVDMHAKLAIEAARAGKHIFMQKSIACSSATRRRSWTRSRQMREDDRFVHAPLF